MNNRLTYPGSLHGHTDYSNLRLRDCIIKLEDAVEYANEIGHSIIAVTEHDCLSNAVRALRCYKEIKKKNPNFKLILGNEIYLCRNGLNAKTYIPGQDRYYHCVLLARDTIGHKQIREISTRAWGRSYVSRNMRRVPTYYDDLFDVIGRNPGHVICSTACLGGAVGTQLLNYKQTRDETLYSKILTWITQMSDLFGPDCFYLEMQPADNAEQSFVNRELLKLSNITGIPYIITCDQHYLKKEDRPIHKAYLNAQNGDREVDDFYSTTYLMTDSELRSYIEKDLTEEEYQVACKNINYIGTLCEDYELEKPLYIPPLKWKIPQLKEIPSMYFDKIKWLDKFVNSEYEGDRVLAFSIIEEVMNDLSFQSTPTYEAIDDNLEKIWVSSEVNNARWSYYLLNLQKIVEECWNAGTIVGPARGSGTGFLLLDILNITQINPLREKTKTYSYRFLNPARVSPLDIDVDISGVKRKQVIRHLQKVYGEDRVSQVATFKTEKAKSAVLTAARGLGIEVDIASYIAGMIEADRGQQRSLKQTFYGDPANGISPNKQFVYEMEENYPELWAVAQKIEGLICGYSSHAGGIIFVDEPFTESTSLMKTPKGETITAFELHDAEAVSLIKMDLLSIEALDKIQECLNLLVEYGYIDDKGNLKDTYEAVIGIYNLVRDDPEMWDMVCEHKINALFQMEAQSGVRAIELAKPTSVDDLAVLNSTLRLMAPEKGAEPPLDKFARFKKDISQWYKEMDDYGLTKQEQEILENIVGISSGLCIAQEQFMELVQLPECGGFDLQWADGLRKSIAKKNPAAYNKLEDEFFQRVEEKNLSRNFCNYVWRVLIAMNRGYGFRHN